MMKKQWQKTMKVSIDVLKNREEFYQFKNQIKNPVEKHWKSALEFYGDDDLPEMFSPEDREHVEFDISSNTKERAANFKLSNVLKMIRLKIIFIILSFMISCLRKQRNQTLIMLKKF